jgi:putative Mg2+ transporter-C (MgtC) family protein
MQSILEFAATLTDQWQVLAEVVVAMLLGGIIGLEREASNKPAGFRTHMLVSGSAALLVGIAFTLVHHSAARGWSGVVSADPIRILQAVVLGVSFLGGGSIIRDRRSTEIHGLTTAASLLMTSGIGIAVALRQYALAIGVTLLVTTVLRVIGRLERRLHQHHRE